MVIVGEAPGAEEEKLCQPFVGRSGKLLVKLLEDSGINTMKDVYFCNVIKCRPPNNRKPTKREINEALPWLLQQIKLISPNVIILTGSTAVNAILGIKVGISKIRGDWFKWESHLVMPIFHPSYLLRNPSKEEGKPLALTQLDLLTVQKKLKHFKSP